MMSRIKVMTLQPNQYRKHRFPPVAESMHHIIPQMSSEGDIADLQHAQMELQQRLEDGFSQGVKQGHEEGIREGVEQGKLQGIVEGKQEGFQAGFQQGEASGRKAFVEAARPVQEMHEKIADWFSEKERQQRQQICDLVQKVSQQVIRAELTLMPQQILALVEETLETLTGKTERVVVYLNPQDLERISNINANLPEAWKLVADKGLPVGGCQLKTDNAEADVSCDSRLEACMKNVRNHLLGGEEMQAELPVQLAATDSNAKLDNLTAAVQEQEAEQDEHSAEHIEPVIGTNPEEATDLEAALD